MHWESDPSLHRLTVGNNPGCVLKGRWAEAGLLWSGELQTSPVCSAMSCPGTQGWPWSRGGRGSICGPRCQPGPRAAPGKQWPLAFTPSLHTGEGEGTDRSAPGLSASSSRAPGSPFRMGLGGQNYSLTPEAGGQFLSSARESLVPNQRGVQKGNGIRQKKVVLVLTEEKP